MLLLFRVAVRVLIRALPVAVAVTQATAYAQDTLVTRAPRATRLDTVVVTVTRSGGTSVLSSPFALSVIAPDSLRPGQRHSAIDEMLSAVPGLWVSNRNNPSQDPRLSIRGFGARSAFGVRGVRVLRDGIPLTLPDGQTPLDYLSLESVGRVEVIRGSASALYGNASGGVIDIRTSAPPAGAEIEARQWTGSDSFLRSAIVGGGSWNSGFFRADVAVNRIDGARAHAAQRATTGFLRAGASGGGVDYTVSVLALDMPLAENPGALTIAELRTNPRLADPLAVRKNARKAVNQIQGALTAARSGGLTDVALSAFAGARSLDNPLTFGVVEIGRHTAGASLRVSVAAPVAGKANRFTMGADFQSQNDLRRNYVNCTDTIRAPTPTMACPDARLERGAVTLDQRELVSGLGVYLNDELSVARWLQITGGIRADRIRFAVRDRLVRAGNPDDSGIRVLDAISPIVGVLMRIAPAHSAYANISSAFETPTATELGNQPDGTAGINRELEPQRSRSIESGMKGEFSSFARYDLSAFTTVVRDELIPFEIPASEGRRFYRNAGRTRRRGAEASLSATAGRFATLGSYSYSRFRFEQYNVGRASFDGNEIPGIPRHRWQGSATVSGAHAFVVLEAEAVGSSWLDDANTIRAPRYEVGHLRVGAQKLFGRPSLSLVIGAQNFFNRRYSPSLVVNAARGRYFEPAPGRSVYAGLTVRGSFEPQRR